MKKLLLVSFLPILLLSCLNKNSNSSHIERKDEISASISKSGVIPCFPERTKVKIKSEDEDATCELSAVAFTNNELIFGNDKTIDDPALSSIFSIPYYNSILKNKYSISYYKNINFKFPKKFEDFAMSIDSKYIFATTSFDRKSDNNEYSSVIYWQTDNKDTVEFITVKEGNFFSKDIHKYIAKALNNPKYFKIEGLAILPNNKMLFGVREKGESYDKFNYSIQFISATLEKSDSKYYLKDDFEIAYNFENSKKYTTEIIGVSSLEWDKYNERLLILTSFEEKKEKKKFIGAYLWTLKLNDLSNKKDPQLIKFNGIPLKFNNKAEGIAMLNKNELFVINDDDRELKETMIDGVNYIKKPHESIYHIVHFNEQV